METSIMKSPPKWRAPRWAVLHNPPQLAGFVVGDFPGTSEEIRLGDGDATIILRREVLGEGPRGA